MCIRDRNCTDWMARLTETGENCFLSTVCDTVSSVQIMCQVLYDDPVVFSQHGGEASEFGVFDERAGVVSRRGGNDVFRRLTQGRRTMY